MKRITGDGGIERSVERLTTTVTALVADVQRLVRLEIELAKQEVLGLVKRNAAAAGMLAAAALGLFFAFIFFQVWLIVLLPHHAIVAGIVAGFWFLLALVLALVGKSRLKIEPPKLMLQSLKDDVEWAKQQIKPHEN
jgi:hypothetical protein